MSTWNAFWFKKEKQIKHINLKQKEAAKGKGAGKGKVSLGLNENLKKDMKETFSALDKKLGLLKDLFTKSEQEMMENMREMYRKQKIREFKKQH